MAAFFKAIRFLLVLFLVIMIVIISYYLCIMPRTKQDAYTFLTSLSPQQVLKCQEIGRKVSEQTWIELLSLYTTLAPEDADYLAKEILSGKEFKQLLSNIPSKEAKIVAYRHSILSKYKLFHPGRYAFPVKGYIWYEDTYGADREGGKRKHEGTDLFAPEGTPIYNVISGRVEKLGWNRLGGERVGVRGIDGNYYYYAHLQKINPLLEIGSKIEQNTLIGYMGHTGDAVTTPDHLHFGIEIRNGVWINPYPFLIVWQYYSR